MVPAHAMVGAYGMGVVQRVAAGLWVAVLALSLRCDSGLVRDLATPPEADCALANPIGWPIAALAIGLSIATPLVAAWRTPGPDARPLRLVGWLAALAHAVLLGSAAVRAML